MQWRTLIRNFGLRFIVSFAALGLIYLIASNLLGSHNKLTGSQKITSLRTSLNQSYIYGNEVMAFTETDAAAYFNLNTLLSQFKTSTANLQKSLTLAGTKISTAQHNKIQSIIDSQTQAASSFQSQYTTLAKVINYDPSTDVGNLDLQKDASRLKQLSQATQGGLLKAAEGNTLATQTAASIRNEAACFGQLAANASAKNVSAVSSLRADCINAYPMVRQAAIQDVIQVAFTASYRNYMNQQVPALLKQLSAAVKI